MSKKMYNTIVILSVLLICSVIFLGVSILYGFTHQATRHRDGAFGHNDRDPISEFVIEHIN